MTRVSQTFGGFRPMLPDAPDTGQPAVPVAPAIPPVGAAALRSSVLRRVAAGIRSAWLSGRVSSFVGRGRARFHAAASGLLSLVREHWQFEICSFRCSRCLDVYNERPHRCADADWRPSE